MKTVRKEALKIILWFLIFSAFDLSQRRPVAAVKAMTGELYCNKLLTSFTASGFSTVLGKIVFASYENFKDQLPELEAKIAASKGIKARWMENDKNIVDMMFMRCFCNINPNYISVEITPPVQYVFDNLKRMNNGGLLNKRALTQFSLEGLISLCDDVVVDELGKICNARKIDQLLENIKPTIKSRIAGEVITIMVSEKEPTTKSMSINTLASTCTWSLEMDGCRRTVFSSTALKKRNEVKIHQNKKYHYKIRK